MDIELGRILRAVRRYWWIPVASAVAFSVLITLIWSVIPRDYTAKATLVVVSTSISSHAFPEAVTPVQAYVELASSDSVLVPVIAEFQINKTPEQFREQSLVVSIVPGTSMIQIYVTDSNAQTGADIANAIAESLNLRADSLARTVVQSNRDVLIYERDQLVIQLTTNNSQTEMLSTQSEKLTTEQETQLDQLRAENLRLEQLRTDIEAKVRAIDGALASSQPPVVMSEKAVAPPEPDGISTMFAAAIGVVLGGLVGVALMLWRELGNKTLWGPEQLAQLAGAPLLASLRSANTDSDLATVLPALERPNAPQVALVTAREENVPFDSEGYASTESPASVSRTSRAIGVLDSAAALANAVSAEGVVLCAIQNETTTDDITQMRRLLHVSGTPILGCVYITAK